MTFLIELLILLLVLGLIIWVVDAFGLPHPFPVVARVVCVIVVIIWLLRLMPVAPSWLR